MAPSSASSPTSQASLAPRQEQQAQPGLFKTFGRGQRLEEAFRLMLARDEWVSRVERGIALTNASTDPAKRANLENLLQTRKQELAQIRQSLNKMLTALELPSEAALKTEWNDGKPYYGTTEGLAAHRAGQPVPDVTVRGVSRDWEDVGPISPYQEDGITLRNRETMCKDWTLRVYDLTGRRDQLVCLLDGHGQKMATAEDQNDFAERDRLYQEWLDYLDRYERTCNRLKDAKSAMLVYEKMPASIPGGDSVAAATTTTNAATASLIPSKNTAIKKPLFTANYFNGGGITTSSNDYGTGDELFSDIPPSPPLRAATAKRGAFAGASSGGGGDTTERESRLRQMQQQAYSQWGGR